MVVAAWVDRPLGDWLDAVALGDAVVDAARALVDDPIRRRELGERIDAVRARLSTLDAPVRGFVPSAFVQPAERVLTLPWAPSTELTLAVIRHDAVRALLREVLTSTVRTFADRLRGGEGGLLAGLGASRPRLGGLMGGMAASLGAAAEGLAGGLQRELEGAVHTKIDAFVESAIEETLKTIAAWIANPQHHSATSALRGSVVEVLLDRPVRDLMAEFAQVPSDDVLVAVLGGLGPVEVPAAVHEAVGDQTIGGWLTAAGLREEGIGAAADAVVRILEPVLEQEAFAAWWARLSS